MIKLNIKLAAAAALSAALLAGCGGGGGSSGTRGDVAIRNIDSASVVKFLQDLISGTSETSEPIDINSLTLAVDDTTDFTPIN